jgi:hypothetical protein
MQSRAAAYRHPASIERTSVHTILRRGRLRSSVSTFPQAPFSGWSHHYPQLTLTYGINGKCSRAIFAVGRMNIVGQSPIDGPKPQDVVRNILEGSMQIVSHPGLNRHSQSAGAGSSACALIALNCAGTLLAGASRAGQLDAFLLELTAHETLEVRCILVGQPCAPF